MVTRPRGIASGEQDRALSGFDGGYSSIFGPVLRLGGVCVLASGLGACALGSVGAMMGGGADGVAGLVDEGQVVVVQAPVETPEHQEFTGMADVIETPVWAALGPLEEERSSRFSFGNMVGMLMIGSDDDEAEEDATPATDASRYVHSLDGLFDDRREVAIAMAVDIFRKNSETRRFLTAARQVVDAHGRPIPAVNAAYQAGEMEADAYRLELDRLDADRRVLSRVVVSLMEQRRIFARARMILISENPEVNLARVDRELAALTQYEDMVSRLSATISGEISQGT